MIGTVVRWTFSGLRRRQIGSAPPTAAPQQTVRADDHGSVYLAFIEGQLAAEWHRRTRMDDQGERILRSAAVAAGLVVSALGIVARPDDGFPERSLVLLVATVSVLLAAAILGVLIQHTFKYRIPDDHTLEQMVDGHWGDDSVDSRNHVARVTIRTTISLRKGNARKAGLLVAGQIVLSAGIGVGVITLLEVLLTR